VTGAGKRQNSPLSRQKLYSLANQGEKLANGGLLPPGDGAASPLAAVAEGSQRYRKLLERPAAASRGRAGPGRLGIA